MKCLLTKIKNYLNRIKVIDVIFHKNLYGTQHFLVISRKPKFLYERQGNWLIAKDGIFYNFYFKKYDSYAQGFAGNKFDIPMKDGSVEHASGQWWDSVHPDYEGKVVGIGAETIENLGRCNVFSSVYIDKKALKEILSRPNPSNNYEKYDKRMGRDKYGVHRIVSRFDEVKP